MATPPTVTGRPGRLTRSADVTAVLRRGRSRSGDLLAVHVLRREVPDDVRGRTSTVPSGASGLTAAARCTVVASRRVGGAVRRNRAKRLLREAARSVAWRDGLDIVLVARSACAVSDLGHVGPELERLAHRLDAVVT